MRPLSLIPALVVLWAAPALAADPRFAVDHFEPSERGSEWFANESLTFQGPKLGPVLVNAGVVSSFAERPFTVNDANGDVVHSPVRDYWVLHAGGDAILFDYLRLAVDMPFQMFVGGKAAPGFGSPKHDQGFGDLRLGADVRVMGHDHGRFRLGLGAQVWAPTGSQAQWSSDGTARLRPRVMVAGDWEWLTWSGQVGYDFRQGTINNEINVSAAAGVRLAHQLVIGPEAYLNAATQHSSVPVEAMVGAHWRILHTLMAGAAIGRGFTDQPGDPEYRIIASIEYAPDFGPPAIVVPPPLQPPPAPSPPPRDDDHDHVPDDVDACKGIAGIPTADPATNGCPPDTDGDTVDDLNDACPTQPGKRTDDPATNGCP